MLRWSTKSFRPVTFLYDTYVLRISNYSVLAIGPPYWYVIPPRICYQYSYILPQSSAWIDCTTVTVMPLPAVTLTDTECWLDGLLYCSRYWTFITTLGWCCPFLNSAKQIPPMRMHATNSTIVVHPIYYEALSSQWLRTSKLLLV